jgi:hypothetical protein
VAARALGVSRLLKGSRADRLLLLDYTNRVTDIYVSSTLPILLNNLSETNIN